MQLSGQEYCQQKTIAEGNLEETLTEEACLRLASHIIPDKFGLFHSFFIISFLFSSFYSVSQLEILCDKVQCIMYCVPYIICNYS